MPKATPAYQLNVELDEEGSIYVNGQSENIESFLDIVMQYEDQSVLLKVNSRTPHDRAKTIFQGLKAARCRVTFSVKHNSDL